MVEEVGLVALAGTAHEQGDRDGSAVALAEDLPTLSTRGLARCSLIAAKVEAADLRELLDEGMAEAIGGARVDEGAVGDEADDALVADAV